MQKGHDAVGVGTYLDVHRAHGDKCLARCHDRQMKTTASYRGEWCLAQFPLTPPPWVSTRMYGFLPFWNVRFTSKPVKPIGVRGRIEEGGRAVLRAERAAAHSTISSIRPTPHPRPPPHRASGRTPVSRRAMGGGCANAIDSSQMQQALADDLLTESSETAENQKKMHNLLRKTE